MILGGVSGDSETFRVCSCIFLMNEVFPARQYLAFFFVSPVYRSRGGHLFSVVLKAGGANYREGVGDENQDSLGLLLRNSGERTALCVSTQILAIVLCVAAAVKCSVIFVSCRVVADSAETARTALGSLGPESAEIISRSAAKVASVGSTVTSLRNRNLF